MSSFGEPFVLSLQLATITTLFLFFMGSFCAFTIYFYNFKGKAFLKALISLPLVLPPTVIGYYLLLSFRDEAFLGGIFNTLFNQRLAFSFSGLVVGSIIFSLPFMVNPILSSLESLPNTYRDAAFTLGKSKLITFRKVLLPNIKSSIVTALVMTFAHTIGEFGVILIIGGNIPNETRVASIAIYNQIEALNYETANLYALVLLIFSVAILTLVYSLQRQNKTLPL